MRKYTTLPINKLVSDVAVDPVHVRELADSIMVSGPISPVLVREENSAIIDGFHRVAAMEELGFNQVECILSPCDDETFWDLRIMSATLHKAVTFARAVDWIGEVFNASPWARKHDSAYGLFQAVRRGTAPSEAEAWANEKAKKWGIGINTLIDWLYARQSLAPDLLTEARQAGTERAAKPYHYVEVATTLPGRPQLQRQVIDKVEREELDLMSTRELSKAVKQAKDEEEAKDILARPFTRKAEDVVREVKVERLISAPPVPEVREVIQRVEMASNVIELKLVWEQVATMAKDVNLALLDSLSESQKEELIQSGERCIQASQKVLDYVRGKVGRFIELPGKEV